MKELRANLKALLDGNGQYSGNNGLALLTLDLDTIAKEIEDLEERIEELEWSEEDYFTIAKDTEFKKTIRKQFVTDSGEPCELFDYFTIDEIDDLVEDIGDDLIKLMEKEHVNI